MADPVVPRVPDLSAPLTVHVVGIGGAGMSAIASVLAAMGHRVSGSDLEESPAVARLVGLGVEVHIGHDGAHLPATLDAVAISTAIPPDNPEVSEATRRGLPVLRRAEILAAIAATRTSIAVAGTHGKTTTSSMLTAVLGEGGLRPSFIIGGQMNDTGSGAAWNGGDLLVVEADESDGTFLELPRNGAVVTSIEADHLEFYGGFEALRAAFGRFISQTPGPRVICADDVHAGALGREHATVTYGTAPDATYRITDLACGRGGSTFRLENRGRDLGQVEVPIAGAYNARNATAAIAMGMELGVAFDAAREALARFGGVARRLEYRGEVAGVTFIDDYAHLPSEVASVLSATADGGWARVVCVFQPHRYSRTEALWRDFAESFEGADLVVITDVYPSGEAPRPGVSGLLVAHAVLDAHPWRRLAYLPGRREILYFLAAELRSGDLCLTLGAGDLTTLAGELQDRLRDRRVKGS